MKSYIGLGSNLGDSLHTLESALTCLTQHAKITLLQVSSFYQSKPHGPKDQPDYINAVAEITTELGAIELLDTLQQIENTHHRKRTAQRWGPRTLDLDLLLYGDRCIHTERLTVPHPRIEERDFVLYPLAEITPTLTFPNGKSLRECLIRIPDTDLIKLEARYDPKAQDHKP